MRLFQRLSSAVRYVSAGGTFTDAFQLYWQRFCENLEEAIAGLKKAQLDLVAVNEAQQEAIEAIQEAQAAAAAANMAAQEAIAAAASAQAAASEANTAIETINTTLENHETRLEALEP